MKLYWKFAKELLKENYGEEWTYFVPDDYNNYRKNWIACHVDMGEEAEVIRKFFPNWAKFYDWRGESEDVMVDDFLNEYDTMFLVSGYQIYWFIRKK